MALALKKGGTYVISDKTADKNSRAVYHYTPGSYNAQKGKLLLQISSLELSRIDFHSIQYPEENQTLQYATNLSPNMSGMLEYKYVCCVNNYKYCIIMYLTLYLLLRH